MDYFENGLHYFPLHKLFFYVDRENGSAFTFKTFKTFKERGNVILVPHRNDFAPSIIAGKDITIYCREGYVSSDYPDKVPAIKSLELEADMFFGRICPGRSIRTPTKVITFSETGEGKDENIVREFIENNVVSDRSQYPINMEVRITVGFDKYQGLIFFLSVDEYPVDFTDIDPIIWDRYPPSIAELECIRLEFEEMAYSRIDPEFHLSRIPYKKMYLGLDWSQLKALFEEIELDDDVEEDIFGLDESTSSL